MTITYSCIANGRTVLAELALTGGCYQVPPAAPPQAPPPSPAPTWPAQPPRRGVAGRPGAGDGDARPRPLGRPRPRPQSHCATPGSGSVLHVSRLDLRILFEDFLWLNTHLLNMP